jgi:hypothetical protein
VPESKVAILLDALVEAVTHTAADSSTMKRSVVVENEHGAIRARELVAVMTMAATPGTLVKEVNGACRLHLRAESGAVEVVEALLDAGAPDKATSDFGPRSTRQRATDAT